jgi:bacterioferritin
MVKAKEGVVELLNSLLTIELTAINQYFVQAEICKAWGFEHLYEKLMDSSMEEMRDSRRLIRHILYLEGLPNMQRMNRVQIGESVGEHIQADLVLDQGAVTALTAGVALCRQVEDSRRDGCSKRWWLPKKGKSTGWRRSWMPSG